jgi:hypothetical protein
MLLLVSMLVSGVSSLLIHGNAVHMSARIPDEKEGRLWVLQSSTVPPNVHGYLGHHTYLVSSLRGVDAGNVSEFHPEVRLRDRVSRAQYKYDPRIVADNGLVAIVVNASLPFQLKCTVLSPHRVLFRGRIPLARIRRLAESPNVLLLIPADKAMHRHSLATRTQLLATPPLAPPFGTGTAIMVTDGGGIDTEHCYFLSKNVTVSSIEYAPGLFTNTTVFNGSHATMTAGIALGQFCGGQMGVANASTLTFFDIEDESGVLQLPLDWTVLYDAAAARNVSLHSISWGINYTGSSSPARTDAQPACTTRRRPSSTGSRACTTSCRAPRPATRARPAW